METAMLRTIFVALLLAGAGLLAGGCLIVNEHASPPRSQAVASTPAAAPVDSRSVEDLRRENAALRPRLATLEDYNNRWRAAIDQRDGEIRELKRQRERLEDERDEAKDAAKKARDRDEDD